FDPSDCPLDCFRPCEAVCSANVIVLIKKETPWRYVLVSKPYLYRSSSCLFNIKCRFYLLFQISTNMQGGVINERNAITTAQLVRRNDVDAIEIHTNGRLLRLRISGMEWEILIAT
ncbi:Oncostatin-M-specific receptor subunit beta, partial [Bienertia sinuspersici]